MTNVLVAYTSLFGNTSELARRVADGARSTPDTEVVLKEGDDVTEADVLAADGVLLGAPIHMGSADHRMKRLIETTLYQLWLTDRAVGKVGGAFCTGGGYGGGGCGAELGLLGLLAALMECGMVCVGLPKSTPGSDRAGLHWGPYARTATPDMTPNGLERHELEAAFHHGANVARVATELRGKQLLATGNTVPTGDVLEQFQNVHA